MPNHAMKLLVRADGGPTIGTGHVMRMLALGQAWKRLGGSVKFVCGQLPNSLIKRIKSESFAFVQTDHDQCDVGDAENLAAIALHENPDWIVLDGYGFDDSYQARLIRSGTRLMVIDDYGHASHEHADFVVNQNAYSDPGDYSHLTHSNVLTGSKYILLRTEFSDSRTSPITPKRTVKEARRILVTFGGADPDNWTLKALQTLSDLNRKRLVVDCVIGACYPHLAELEMFKKSAKMNLRIHRNVDRMATLMLRVDMAVTAGGSTCYELARCGVPSIVMSIAANQKPIADALNQKKVMLSIDQPDGELDFGRQGARLKNAIRELINDPVRRQAMASNGTMLVDGQGARRIAQTLIGASFALRNVRLADAKTMWHWRNDPEVRSVSLTDSPDNFENHTELLRQQIEEAHTELWISEDSNGRPVAEISFEITRDQQTAYVGIIVDQTQRGRGVGPGLINNACQQFFASSPVNEIVAQIKPGNAASEKAFRTAGFHPIEPAIINGKMAFQFLRSRKDASTSASSLKKSA